MRSPSPAYLDPCSCLQRVGAGHARMWQRSLTHGPALLLPPTPPRPRPSGPHAQVWDSRNASLLGGFSPLTAAIPNQGTCWACSSLAIGAAAEAAFACALRQNASSWFGVQDFHFCASVDQGSERSCMSPWTLPEALEALSRLQAQGLPVHARCLPYSADAATRPCAYRCRDPPPFRGVGTFRYARLSALPEVQAWIRQHGAVISSIEVTPALTAYFKANPRGVFRGQGVWVGVGGCWGLGLQLGWGVGDGVGVGVGMGGEGGGGGGGGDGAWGMGVGMGQRWGAKQWATWGRCACRQLCCSSRTTTFSKPMPSLSSPLLRRLHHPRPCIQP
jgi:hypothetical protein